VVAYFAVLGVANGVWLARIPAVKQNLHLSDGVLGLALLAAPAGLVVVVPFTSRIIGRAGSRRPTMIAGTCAALVPIALGLSPNLAALMASLFAFGLAGGMLDVAMNSQAVIVERAVGRPLMTSFHSCYSFGGLAGALVGGAFAWAGIGPGPNFISAGIPLAIVAVLAGRWLLRDDGNGAGAVLVAAGPADVALPAGRRGGVGGSARRGARGSDERGGDGSAERGGRGSGERGGDGAAERGGRWPRPRVGLALVFMAALAICSLLGEGAADGWSAVYLRDNLGASAGLAALAYAGFSVAMAFGRLSGDRLAIRLGPVAVMRLCGLVAAAGLSLALLSGSPAGAIAGFTVFGAGLSCTFPLLLSAAGNVNPAQPSYGISRVAGVGYVGMLGGPVLIGGLASGWGLTTALTVPVFLALGVAVGAGVVRRRPVGASPRGTDRDKSPG
jgi:MFS family permease